MASKPSSKPLHLCSRCKEHYQSKCTHWNCNGLASRPIDSNSVFQQRRQLGPPCKCEDLIPGIRLGVMSNDDRIHSTIRSRLHKRPYDPAMASFHSLHGSLPDRTITLTQHGPSRPHHPHPPRHAPRISSSTSPLAFPLFLVQFHRLGASPTTPCPPPRHPQIMVLLYHAAPLPWAFSTLSSPPLHPELPHAMRPARLQARGTEADRGRTKEHLRQVLQ